MEKFLKFFEALGEADAQPLVNVVATMIAVGGLVVCLRLILIAQPYTYRVQCKVPAAAGSRITLTSRRSGLVTEGPLPDASGAAEVTSDKRFEDYDVTFEGGPCRHAGGE